MQNTIMQNTIMQNTIMQNGATLNGAPLMLARVDLTTMRRLITPPAAGQDPDLSPGNLIPVGNVTLDKSALTDPNEPATGFANRVVSGTFVDAAGNEVAGDVFIESVTAPSTSDPNLSDVYHYILRAHHPFVPAPGSSCPAGGCPMIWEYACGTSGFGFCRNGVCTPPPPTPATAMGGYWDFHHGDGRVQNQIFGNKVVESSSPLYKTQITFACVDGAIGKCVEKMHYKPWAPAASECAGLWFNGTLHCMQPSQELLHEACVRMVRADYCGDNNGHTVKGMDLDVWDQSRINVETAYTTSQLAGGVPWGHEAKWTPNGAYCVSNAMMGRVADPGGTKSIEDYLSERCWTKWPGRDWFTECFTNERECIDDKVEQTTFAFGNVPWSFASSQPAMDLHNRVLIENKSVCVEDVGLTPNTSSMCYPNADKHSETWCHLCLPQKVTGSNSICYTPPANF